MDELSSGNWKVVQTKTFTKWVNNKLKKAGFDTIDSLFADLSSGIALVNLLNALGKVISKYNTSPHSRIQKMENLKIILDFIKEQNIALVNIGPEDIVDGDQKLILGLIWTLISKLSISDILTSEFFTMKEEILSWAQRVTEEYKNVKIEDLSSSWQDGLGFSAIIHKFRPNLMPDFHSMDPKNKYENCSKAFKIAEEHLEIPKLFDPEDIIDVIRPDERSVMTYLSQFYQKFLSEERQIAAKDKLKNTLKAIDWSIEARNSYERKAEAFLKEKKIVHEKVSALSSILKTVVEELRKIQDTNTDLIVQSAELHLLLNDIQDVHQLMSLKSYHPPERLSVDKIDMSYLNVSSILDLNSIKCEVSEFENTEALELVRVKDISNQIYTISDKESQILAVSSNEPKFNPVHLCSLSKQKAADKLREFFESKKEKLKRFIDLKKASDLMIGDAKKMFKIKDVKKSGLISISDFKKILRALRFEPSLVEDSVASMEGSISSEKMEDVLVRLSYSKMVKSQIVNAFKEIGSSGKLKLDSLLANYSIKGLAQIVGENNEIEVEKILEMVDE
ncbi:uncharacterized protein VICG_01049 [Vittaforma corneae ATCC 50505]|uniref:Calponin-homology (CH) domain-containing protein n=1 Tax=Vittaforma corneae (strain ATCC 50505) TaxID=993615 RepID=L2GMY2_VITCO|nr:uncharacterized protein VICG_01049 [Vittaforma corneae ATCC 50505]ELA41865.1 hypothetical protein VICG_01049 [Vittaforma corneae ATCC 50505]